MSKRLAGGTVQPVEIDGARLCLVPAARIKYFEYNEKKSTFAESIWKMKSS
jgi:hypothetical protein